MGCIDSIGQYCHLMISSELCLEIVRIMISGHPIRSKFIEFLDPKMSMGKKIGGFSWNQCYEIL